MDYQLRYIVVRNPQEFYVEEKRFTVDTEKEALAFIATHFRTNFPGYSLTEGSFQREKSIVAPKLERLEHIAFGQALLTRLPCNPDEQQS